VGPTVRIRFAPAASLQNASKGHLQTKDFDTQLSQAANIDAVVVIGRTIRESNLQNLRRIRRVIFPHPQAESTKRYARTVNEQNRIERDIVEATIFLKESHIDVRWYPDMIHQTFLIGDGELRNRWVHLETVLPYSYPNLRQSWMAHRLHHEQLVASFTRIFEEMWKASNQPNKELIERYQDSHIV
jgi:hypothetical protein